MYLIDALTADPQGLIKNALRVFHFFGLAIGLGTATVLDLIVVRFFLGKPIRPTAFDLFEFCAKVVNWGLVALWISGIGFLLFYAAFDPKTLTNEKIWAKITIVVILSINGFFIHKVILPFLTQQKGKTLLEDVPIARQRVFVTSAMISVVSWYGPLVIANLSHLNFSVPMLEILAAYALVLAVVLTCAHLVLRTGIMSDTTVFNASDFKTKRKPHVQQLSSKTAPITG